MKKHIVLSFFTQILILILSFYLITNLLDIILSFSLIYMSFIPYMVEFLIKEDINIRYFYLVNVINIILFMILIVF